MVVVGKPLPTGTGTGGTLSAWQATTDYSDGETVITPGGATVSRSGTGTSGAAYDAAEAGNYVLRDVGPVQTVYPGAGVYLYAGQGIAINNTFYRWPADGATINAAFTEGDWVEVLSTDLQPATMATLPIPSQAGQVFYVSDAPEYNSPVAVFADGVSYVTYDGTRLFPDLFNSTYQLYYHVPYLGGSTSKLKTLVEGASTSPRQFVFRGDSQESIPGSGEVFIQELNRIAFRRYGQPRYSPWMTTGTFLENALWLTGTEDAGATQTADEPIPGFRVWNQDATTTGSLWTLYPDAGSEGNPRDGNYFSTNALEFEVLLRRNTANTAEECEIIAYSTENPRTYRFGSSGGFTTHNEVASTGLNLNSADNEYVTFNSGLLSYDNARPYNSVYIRGLVGGAAVADSNMNFVSARWIASDRNSGLTWNTWSQGGYEVTNHTGDHPDLAVIVQALGGYPFDAVIHSLGANDAGSSLNTPSAWKTSTEAMISNTRTVFGADQFIILISEPPRRDYGGLDTQLTDNFNRYAAVLYEAAEADGNCVFLNLGRMLYEVDPDFGLPSSSGGTYLQDTVHLNDASQSLAAEKIYELIDMI